MDEKKIDKEQKRMKKLFRAEVTFTKIFLHLVTIIMIVFSLACTWVSLEKLLQGEDTKKQLIDGAVAFVMFVVLEVINVYWNCIVNCLLDIRDKREWEKNRNQMTKIKDLHTALHYMAGCSGGIIVWDTIWGVIIGSMLLFLVMFFGTCRKSAVMGTIIVSAVMLFAGHIGGKKIWWRRSLNNKIVSYTKKYYSISNETEYVEAVDKSVQKGVLFFSNMWLMTEDFVIGRLSDIVFDPVAIPRETILQYTFFYKVHVYSKRTLPQAILKCRLNNGKSVECVIGQGNSCNALLQRLNELGIPWDEEEEQYI